MIRRLTGVLLWVFWSLVGSGWCFSCRARLWTGPRSKDWIAPIFCPKCHAVVCIPSKTRRMLPSDFAPPAPATRAELEAAAGIVQGPIQ